MADLVRNRPSPEGRALGAELARLTDVAAAEKPWLDTRCPSCAFRAGTVPNGCASTLMDAVKCLAEGSADFLCHHKYGKPTLCAGFMLLTDGGQRGPLVESVPWEFST